MDNVLRIMFNLFLISSIINMLYIRINGVNILLNCGLFGFSGKDGNKPDLRKLLVLGLYNRTRGTDSTGYYYNGNIVKGVDKMADFKDFIVDNRFTPGDLPFENLMAHTRKSTYGSNSLENAHPHVVGNLVQTHNGTLKNIWELCKKYDIDHGKIHVDSIGLATIIEKVGFQPLNEYTGAAALTMVFMDDPESLYLYHGASREKEAETIWEERPMFTLKTKEGLYYSSMKESLTMINTSKTNVPEILPHNKVWLIKNGNIVDNIYSVSRENVNIPKVYTTTYYPEKKPAIVVELPFVTKSVKKVGESMIFKESKPLEFSTQDVYYQYGRHMATVSSVDGNNYMYTQVLLNGGYRIDREGKILEEGVVSEYHYDTLYFIRGVMMINQSSYLAALAECGTFLDNPKIELDSNISFFLSDHSRYPVTSFPTEGTSVSDDMRNAWYLRGKRFSGTIIPRFTKRRYKIKKGQLKGIIPAWDKEELMSGVSIQLSNYDIDLPSNKLCISEEEMLNDVNEEFTEEQLNSFTEDSSISEFFDIISQSIETWSDLILTEKQVTKIPEEVLIFMEYAENDFSPTELRAAERFDAVTVLLNDLINTKQTYLEYLKSIFEQDFISAENIADCFKTFTSLELLEMDNRYILNPFSKEIEKLDEPLIQEAVVISTNNDSCTMPDPEEINTFTMYEDTPNNREKVLARIQEYTAIAEKYRSLDTQASISKAWEVEQTVEGLKATIAKFKTTK